MSSLFFRAVRSLHPEAEVTISGENFEDVVWNVINGEPPSIKEIEAEMARIQLEDEKKIAELLTRRAAILNRLGLTEDEAKLILS